MFSRREVDGDVMNEEVTIEEYTLNGGQVDLITEGVIAGDMPSSIYGDGQDEEIIAN